MRAWFVRAQLSSRCTIRLASTSKVAPASLGRSVVHASTQPDGSATRSRRGGRTAEITLTFVSPHQRVTGFRSALERRRDLLRRFLTERLKVHVATWSGGPSAA